MTLPLNAKSPPRRLLLGAPARRKGPEPYFDARAFASTGNRAARWVCQAVSASMAELEREFSAAASPRQRRLLMQASVENVVELAARLACDSTASVAFEL